MKEKLTNLWLWAVAVAFALCHNRKTNRIKGGVR